MKTNNTKLTDEELHMALHNFNGMITYQVKRSLEKVINTVYDIAYKKGFDDGANESVKDEFKNLDPIDLDQLDK